VADDAELVERLRAISLILPEATEVDLFGNPTFRVATVAFAAFERDSGVPVVRVKQDLDDQAVLVTRDGFEPAPETGGHGWTNVRLDLGVDWDEIDPLVVASYRLQAPKHLREALDELLEAAGEEPIEEIEEPVELDVPVAASDRRVLVVIEVPTDDDAGVVAAEEAWRVATVAERAPSRILHGTGPDGHLLVVEYATAADADHDDALGASRDLLEDLTQLSGGIPPGVRRYEVVRSDRR
jgi:predicted DNA-binding protein (MmcQ/YjbR family)